MIGRISCRIRLQELNEPEDVQGIDVKLKGSVGIRRGAGTSLLGGEAHGVIYIAPKTCLQE
jgi:hypothetical protein